MMQRKKQIEKLLEDTRMLKRKMLFGMAGHLKDGHITASQWLVLRYLRKSEGTTLKEIAQTLNMTSSAATQLVKSLVQKGYVIRKTSRDDKRALNLSLSDKSKKRMEALRRERIQEMEHVFDILTDAEFEAYCRLHEKIAESLAVRKK
jgi:DNA-binding MarR family transcriptional regulator